MATSSNAHDSDADKKDDEETKNVSTASADDSLIDDFCGFTGGTSVEARHFLEACEGSLNEAVSLYLQNNATTSDRDVPAPQLAEEPVDAEKFEEEVVIRAPIPQRYDVLVDESFDQSYAAPRYRPTTSSVFDPFRNVGTEAAAQGNFLRGHRPLDAKRQTLEDLFKPPVHLTHRGTFETAKDEAVSRGRWLLVNVQNVREFACQALNRDIWKNSAVAEIVLSNFVLWQLYNDTADGRRFQTFYHVNDFPFVGIVDPRTGELMVTVPTGDRVAFCDALMTFLGRNPSFLSSPKRPFSAEMNGTGDAALPRESSLSNGYSAMAGPSSSSAVISNGVGGLSPPKKRRLATPESTPASSADMPDINEFLNPSSSSTPSRSTVVPGAWKDFIGTEGKNIRLKLRLPDGSFEQLVLTDTSLLKALALYVEERGFAPSTRYEFELNHPLRTLHIEADAEKTLKELEFNAQEVVYVQDR